MNQPGGQTLALGGASIVQTLPAHDTLGNRIRDPIELPCVLEIDATSETLMFAVEPWKRWTLIW